MKKVMVLDDSETVRKQVGAALEGAGYAAIEAKDGLDGLAQLEADPQIAMVVLDVNMPRMGGLEMLDRMRKHETLAATPVLVLTTEADPSLIDRARSAGAKGWLVKPVKPDLLVKAVDRFLG
jgi:two-component system chemotaxis response regulator CheY